MSQPYVLTDAILKRVLAVRERKLAEGTRSRYLLQQIEDKVCCKGCGKELKAGNKVWPTARNSYCVSKYYCYACARRYHLA